jgi:undecaprenyl-diphosphatase
MNNMAVAASLSIHLPWLWPFALALPLAMGLLRVLFGVHFLSDIVAGALLGLLSAFAAGWLYETVLGIIGVR